VPYGPSVSAFAVYMTQYQLLPYQRTAEVLNELAGLGISPGTLQRQPNDSFNSLVLTVQSQPPMPPLE